MLNALVWESLRYGSASSDFYQQKMSGKWKGVVSASPLRSPFGRPGAPELPTTPSSHGLVAILELGFSTLPALPAVLGHSTPEQSFEYSGGVAWLGTINEP